MKRLVLLAMIIGCATTDTEPPPLDPVHDPADPVPDDPTPTDPPPIDPLRALQDWQACMTRTDYDAAGMAPAWSGLDSSTGYSCEGCHAAGGNGFVASADAAFGFETIKTEMFQLMSYVTVDDASRVVPNLPLLIGLGTGQASPAHPRFDTAPNNRGFSALRDFYDRTEARRLAGECGPVM